MLSAGCCLLYSWQSAWPFPGYHQAPLRNPQFFFSLNGDRFASSRLLCFLRLERRTWQRPLKCGPSAVLRKGTDILSQPARASGGAYLGLFPAQLFEALYVTGSVLTPAVYKVDRFDVSLG
jgi:hypothetical protein